MLAAWLLLLASALVGSPLFDIFLPHEFVAPSLSCVKPNRNYILGQSLHHSPLLRLIGLKWTPHWALRGKRSVTLPLWPGERTTDLVFTMHVGVGHIF